MIKFRGIAMRIERRNHNLAFEVGGEGVDVHGLEFLSGIIRSGGLLSKTGRTASISMFALKGK
jgi:hypothetical protein